MNCHLKFLNKIIKTSFVIQQFSTEIPKLIQLIFGMVAQLQILSYLEQPGYKSINSFTNILFFARPHIFIVSQGNFWIVFIVQFFIFQILISLWIYISVTINANTEKNIINQIQYIQQNSKKTQLIIQIISIFLFLNKIYLGSNIVEFNLLVIQGQPTYIIVFAILQIFQIILILILQWQILNRSIKFIPTLQYLTINQSYTNSFNLILKSLQIILYVTAPQNALFGQSLLILVSFGHKIFQVEINNILMHNLYQKMIIFFSSMGITLGLLGLAVFYESSIGLRLWVLLMPLLYYLVTIFMRREFYQLIYYRSFEQMSISQLKYFSCLLYKGIDFSIQQNKLLIFSYLRRNKSIFEKVNCIAEQELSKLALEAISVELMKQIIKTLEELSVKQKNPFKLHQIYINYIQILIVQNKFVEAQTIIEQLFKYKIQGSQKIVSKAIKLVVRAEMNGVDRIYLEILEDKIIDQIKKKMTQQSFIKTKNHQSISLALKQLSTINSNTIDVQTIFRNVLNFKIEFLNFILRDKVPPKQYSDKVHFTLTEMDSLLKKLKQNYNVFPTIQNQSILMIYKVEILNNVYDAYVFSQTIALDEDIFLKHHHSEMFNFFNQSFNFIVFEIHDVQNIQIKYHCITQQNLFSIKEGDQLQTLIPVSLRLQHYYMVEHFLQDGKNKYFQSVDESYITLRPGVFSPIDICMDLNQINTQNIEIITVYRSPQSDKQILFVDSSLRLQEISLHLFECGFNLDENQLQFLIGTHIQKIIPNFKRYLDEKQFDVKNCPINLLTVLDDLDSKTKSKTYNYLDDLDQVSFYSCHLNIRKRYYYGDQFFYVLKIDNLKQDRTYSCSQFRMTQNSEPYQEVDEEIEINVPEVDENDQKYQIVLYTDRLDPMAEMIPQNQEFNKYPDQKITETSLFKINNIQDVPQSQISSVEEIKRSPYFKIFQLISALINSEKKSKNLISYGLLYFLYIILVLTFSIKVMVVTYELKDFISNVRLLSIKNEVYQPIESFLLTRYTLLTNNLLLSLGQVSESEHTELIVFPKSNLLSGFDDLKVSISKVLDYPEFQPFLEDKYLNIYLYEHTNEGVQYNISFRSCIHLLLEYQYEYKLAYTVKTLQVDSPYFYYSYKNYITLFNKFVELQAYTLEQTFNICESKLQEILLYFITFSIMTIIITAIEIYHLYQIRTSKNRILTLIKNQEFQQIDSEILRLKQLQSQIIQKRELIYNYNFNLQSIDNILKKKQVTFKQRQMIQKQQISLKIYLKIFLNSIHYVIFFGLSLAFYMVMQTYLQDYRNTAQFYQKISDAGVNVLKVYAWKEALYFKASFTFLNESEIQEIYDEVENSLETLKTFTISLLNIDQMQYLFDSDSEQKFERLISQSICDVLSDKYYTKAQPICGSIMSGVLKRGLINTLTYMINSINTEYQSTHFNNRTTYVKLELEGATLASDVIQQLVDTLKLEFQIQTTKLQLELYIAICLYMIFEVMSIQFTIRFIRNEEFRLNLLKKFVYLIPSGTLFYDEYFQRAMNRIIFN